MNERLFRERRHMVWREARIGASKPHSSARQQGKSGSCGPFGGRLTHRARRKTSARSSRRLSMVMVVSPVMMMVTAMMVMPPEVVMMVAEVVTVPPVVMVLRFLNHPSFDFSWAAAHSRQRRSSGTRRSESNTQGSGCDGQ
jgi:hypothetical protein